MIRYKRIVGFALLLFVLFSTAQAHEIRPSIVSLNFADDRTYELAIETNLEALIAQIGPEHEDTDDAPNADFYKRLRALEPAELEAEFDTIKAGFLKDAGLKFGDESAAVAFSHIYIAPVSDVDLARDSTIVLTGTVPQAAQTFRWAFPPDKGSSVLRIARPGQELQAQFFAVGAVSEPFDIGVAEPRAWWEAAWDYLVIGFTHILPKGLDHILFVLGLFLLSPKWRPLLWQVTAFTIAHSVTLGLGLYGVVNISPSIVEPLIALSIVYVAIENVFTAKLQAWRPVIVFAFGLLHGLGFAGILTEIGIPRSEFILGLVAFNVGVELGQLTVIALALLAVGWFIAKPWYRQRITIPASLVIAAVGAWWFVERTFL